MSNELRAQFRNTLGLMTALTLAVFLNFATQILVLGVNLDYFDPDTASRQVTESRPAVLLFTSLAFGLPLALGTVLQRYLAGFLIPARLDGLRATIDGLLYACFALVMTACALQFFNHRFVTSEETHQVMMEVNFSLVLMYMLLLALASTLFGIGLILGRSLPPVLNRFALLIGILEVGLVFLVVPDTTLPSIRVMAIPLLQLSLGIIISAHFLIVLRTRPPDDTHLIPRVGSSGQTTYP